MLCPPDWMALLCCDIYSEQVIDEVSDSKVTNVLTLWSDQLAPQEQFCQGFHVVRYGFLGHCMKKYKISLGTLENEWKTFFYHLSYNKQFQCPKSVLPH